MTNARSPLRDLKAQADLMAEILKNAERGDPLPAGFSGFVQKFLEARKRPSVTFAVFMDDKALQIEMSWQIIGESTQAAISEFILGQMRKGRDADD